ncbi:hypothetical protein SRABI70_03644 [Pseudomonas sp. Bi70]|nr:hypothetical protein SRABI70_03644 [Pseudomonas sp. Bi70]
MDVAGALLERVLEQPVDDVHHVGIVGIRLLVLGAKVEQLLEVADVADLGVAIGGAADRAGQAVELHGEALDIRRVGHHALDRALEHMHEVGFPAVHERLGAGDGHRLGIDCHGEDLVALGEGVGHQRSDRRRVDLQRVDTQVRLPGQLRQPEGQAFQVENAPRARLILKLLGGQEFQRVQVGVGATAADRQALLGAFLGDTPLADQLAQQLVEIQQTVGGGRRKAGHAGS